MAAAYTSLPGGACRAPASPLAGLLAWLRLVAEYPFSLRPVVVDVDCELQPAGMQEAWRVRGSYWKGQKLVEDVCMVFIMCCCCWRICVHTLCTHRNCVLAYTVCSVLLLSLSPFFAPTVIVCWRTLCAVCSSFLFPLFLHPYTRSFTQAFQAQRAASPQGMALVTPLSPLHSAWTASAPLPVTVSRMAALAAATLRGVERVLTTPSRAAAAQPDVHANWRSLYVPSLAAYDVVLVLTPSELAGAAGKQGVERHEGSALLDEAGLLGVVRTDSWINMDIDDSLVGV